MDFRFAIWFFLARCLVNALANVVFPLPQGPDIKMIPFISLFPSNDRSLADTSFRQTGHEGDDSFRGFLRRLVFRVDKQLILAPVFADPLIVFDVGADLFVRREAPFFRTGP